MINIEINSAKSFINENDFKSACNLAKESFNKVIDGSGRGSNWLGWRGMMRQPNDAELDRIQQHATRIRNSADIFIICGIGGSYLGAKSIIDALGNHFKAKKPEIIFAGHQMGGKYLKELINYLDEPLSDGSPKSVYVNVISKSGSTLETALAFRCIRAWIEKTYPEETSERIIATTGKEGGVLNKIIETKGYEKYIIPDNIGGRFSVLTPVGLLPVAVAGIDIQTLFYGAVSEFKKNEKDPTQLLDFAALRYVLHKKGFALDVIGSFEPELTGFTSWIQQLLGESEGKEGMGLFPATASFSTDLHSIGQLIQQGQRNMIETLLVVEQPISDYTVPEMANDVDQLSYLEGKSFHDINKSALDGTVQAHHDGGVPITKVIIEKLNEQQIGELIYFYFLVTAVYVYMLNINPFNQPGVEDYKKAMYRLLGKGEN